MKPRIRSIALSTFLRSRRAVSESRVHIHGPECVHVDEADMELIQRVSGGESNTEIGQSMGFATSTIKNRLAVLFFKFHVHTRSALVSAAYRLGLLK